MLPRLALDGLLCIVLLRLSNVFILRGWDLGEFCITSGRFQLENWEAALVRVRGKEPLLPEVESVYDNPVMVELKKFSFILVDQTE